MSTAVRVGVSAVLCLGLVALAVAAGPAAAPDVLDVAPVWSGHPVKFALLTCGPRQFVAFYDADRQMTVASRKTDEAGWHFVKLPTKVGWDSHNSIVMVADDEGLLHLSGNMHCVPLVYFRTEKPYEIDSFKQVPSMVGREEKSCTYPAFLRGAKNELLFTYRDGRSGNGSQILNVWDPKTHTWGRMLDQPLFSGEGKMNAYFRGPVQGPDGCFHVIWVWRNSPDCATNHDLSYARSRDLVHWETSAGKPLALPITLKTGE
ncbi:MAG: BNR repeat-containing protein, partial [Planctomycetota bacterium]|nr:BNR repeat-containing protein [Planctomycetota bacterium]